MAIFLLIKVIRTTFQFFTLSTESLKPQTVDRSLRFTLNLIGLNFSQQIYYTLISQIISLIFVGSIISINIKSMMQSVLFLFKKLNTDIGVKVETNKMTLILTQAMCCYFISSVLQMSLNLP